MPHTSDDLIWAVRTFVYQRFADTARATSADEVAAQFRLTREAAMEVYDELDRRHAFFLEPGTHDIRIANPFSAIPTDFVVRAAGAHAQGREYWANCAWDSLGIAAALHSDAVINTAYAEDDAPLTLTIRDGVVHHPPAVVHLLVPVRNWYDDMIFT